MGDNIDSDAACVGDHRAAPSDMMMSVLLFDSAHNILCDLTCPTAPAAAEHRWLEIVSIALSTQCRCLLLRQYVSTGEAFADRAQVASTRRLARHLRLLDLRLCDHVMRSDRATFSFRANGLL